MFEIKASQPSAGTRNGIFLKCLPAKFWLWALVIFQLFSVTFMAIGTWPLWVVWVNLALSGGYLILASTFDGLLFLALSVPFYVAVPNPYSDSLSLWRIWFLLLFALWVGREFSALGFKGFLRQLKRNFQIWDIYLAVFLVLALFSALVARYPAQSIKQTLFFVNIYLVYVVIVNTLKNSSQALKLIKHTAGSLAFIVFIGYVQLLATFFASYDYFWKYWAVRVSSLYYGVSLGNVLLYSNSWFSYIGKNLSLRMFSIMPDSHSFAMIGAFAIVFLLPLTEISGLWRQLGGRTKFFYPHTQKSGAGKPWKNSRQIRGAGNGPYYTRMGVWVYKRSGYLLWSAIRFSGLAIAFSGTRGMWVGLLAPLALSMGLYLKAFVRPFTSKIFWSLALIILFFALSPFINYGLNLLKVSRFEENFLDRAKSVYNLREESNVNRLLIWRESLKYALAHPLGAGYGNFIVSLVPEGGQNLSYNELSRIKNLRYNLPQKFVTAHSLYLNVLVELGVLGLIVFCLYFVGILWELGRFLAARPNLSGPLGLFVFSFVFGLIWFLAYGVFDVALFNDKILIYLFISLGLASFIKKTPQVLDIT